jgi:two-component system sensor histidine kinase UhpB
LVLHALGCGSHELMSEPGGHAIRDHTPEATLRLAVDSLAADHALVTLDAQGTIASWNAGAERLFGWRRERVLGAHVSTVLGAGGAYPGIGAEDLAEAKRHGSVIRSRRLNHEDGSTIEATTILLVARTDAGVAGYAVVAQPIMLPVLRDPTQTSEQNPRDTPPDTQRQLSETTALLAAEIADRRQAEVSRARLLRRLVVAQEDERRRLARDLHDNLGQRLTALRLILETLDGAETEDGAEPTRTATALEMLARIDQDVDFIAWELRPAALEELGLTAVLDTYVR